MLHASSAGWVGGSHGVTASSGVPRDGCVPHGATVLTDPRHDSGARSAAARAPAAMHVGAWYGAGGVAWGSEGMPRNLELSRVVDMRRHSFSSATACVVQTGAARRASPWRVGSDGLAVTAGPRLGGNRHGAARASHGLARRAGAQQQRDSCARARLPSSACARGDVGPLCTQTRLATLVATMRPGLGASTANTYGHFRSLHARSSHPCESRAGNRARRLGRAAWAPPRKGSTVLPMLRGDRGATAAPPRCPPGFTSFARSARSSRFARARTGFIATRAMP